MAHIKAGLGCGGDYVASIGTPLYAPFDGTITTYSGVQGGKWSRLTRSNGDKIEMAHLDSYFVTSGEVKEGKTIAMTGNTGSITTGEHLHIQILDKNNKRLDPETYVWDNTPMTCQEQLAKEKAAHAETLEREQTNYKNWQTEIEQRHAVEKERDAAQAKLKQIKDIVAP